MSTVTFRGVDYSDDPGAALEWSVAINAFHAAEKLASDAAESGDPKAVAQSVLALIDELRLVLGNIASSGRNR